MNAGFQIDLYGFSCDIERKLLFLDWDMVTVRIEDFLPMISHKTLPNSKSSNLSSGALASPPSFALPFNTHCLLSIWYGASYERPLQKESYPFEYDGHLAAGNFSDCNKEKSVLDIEESIQQQRFC